MKELEIQGSESAQHAAASLQLADNAAALRCARLKSESAQHAAASLQLADNAVALRCARSRKRRQRGITLIEMLVVVTIIALFAALVAPRMFGQADKAKKTAARAQVNSFMTALGAYKLATGTFPTTEQGLQALRVKPDNMPQWDGPYLPQDIPMDPWARPYLYKYPGDHGDEPDIISLGADGQPGGEGTNADIVSWSSQ